MKPFSNFVLPFCCVLITACGEVMSPPVDQVPDENWVSYGGNDRDTHYSPLSQINASNVADLKLSWFHDLEPVANPVVAPIAIDGVLYFAYGYSVLHAMDAVTGQLLWKYDPKVPEVAGEKLRGGWGVRGIAYSNGKIFVGTHDGRLIAVDAKDGSQVWSVQSLDKTDATYITGAPWVLGDKVAIGFGGGDFGAARGYVTAYDAETGSEAWRFYVVPGNPADGFENAAMEMAAETWTGEWWKYGGGGTVWNAMAYDKDLNLVYLGTGNGTPVNQKIRSPGGGDNLFLCSIVALNADTGEYVWHYQVNPGETWDYNASMDIELAELEIDGEARSVLLHAPKNGFFYVIDRKTGELLSAEKFVRANWAESIDLTTGRPIENPEARFPDGKGSLVYPSTIGARSIQAMSYSPKSGLAYFPAIDREHVFADPAGDLSEWQMKPGMAVNQGLGAPSRPIERKPESSELMAWDPVEQKKVWSVPQTGIFNGGTAATAGNLVFQGQLTGHFSAFSADSGELLWQFDTQTGVQSNPITYTVDGVQYVTVIAGWRGMGNPSGLDIEWEYRLQPRRVLTFALNGDAELPAAGPRSSPFLDDPQFVVDDEKALLGRTLTFTHCGLCHGFGLRSGGAAPDLRKSALPLNLDGLKSVLQDGALLPRGMPQFSEFTDEQVEAIQHYIRQQARAQLQQQ